MDTVLAMEGPEMVPKKADETTLKLAPHRELRIQAQDVNGRPLGLDRLWVTPAPLAASWYRLLACVQLLEQLHRG